MKNPLLKTIYHSFVCWFYKMGSYRGGWMLTHLFYLDYIYHKAKFLKVARTHLKGWSYSDWRVLGITDKTHKEYLSTRDYCSLHPFNGEYSSWIDDKVTLKYILHGTKAGKYMPEYYYELISNGTVIGLMDLDAKYELSCNGVIELLRDKHILAFKLVKASLGIGFYKAEYKNGSYWLNDEEMSYEHIKRKLENMSGYLITEYLLPHPEIAKLSQKSVGCLRYLIGRRTNGELIFIYSFMRFGTQKSEFVENYNSGGVLAIVNNGRYSEGNILDSDNLTNIKILKHPDSGAPITGVIPQWEEITKAAGVIADVMPQLSYMGIDFCVTADNKVKVIEINSLTSLDCIQKDKSILKTPAGVFYRERINP